MINERKIESNQRHYRRLHNAINAKRRAKYRDDPEYKAKTLLNVKRYQCENPEKVKAYRNANKERRNAQAKSWREENSERKKEYQEQYRKDNRDGINQYQRDYHEANRDVLRAKRRQYCNENSDKIAESQRRYRKENASKIYSKNAQRRALLKGAKVERVDYDIIYLRDNGICGICENELLREDMTLDHIIPLSRGGEHSAINVQVAHLSCNRQKGIKTRQEMALA